jgi:hypothetical protein
MSSQSRDHLEQLTEILASDFLKNTSTMPPVAQLFIISMKIWHK